MLAGQKDSVVGDAKADGAFKVLEEASTVFVHEAHSWLQLKQRQSERVMDRAHVVSACKQRGRARLVNGECESYEELCVRVWVWTALHLLEEANEQVV